jgi:hypothetical protein
MCVREVPSGAVATASSTLQQRDISTQLHHAPIVDRMVWQNDGTRRMSGATAAPGQSGYPCKERKLRKRQHGRRSVTRNPRIAVVAAAPRHDRQERVPSSACPWASRPPPGHDCAGRCYDPDRPRSSSSLGDASSPAPRRTQASIVRTAIIMGIRNCRRRALRGLNILIAAAHQLELSRGRPPGVEAHPCLISFGGG